MIVGPLFPTLGRAACTVPRIFNINRLHSSSRVTPAPVHSRVYANMTINNSLADDQIKIPVCSSRVVNDIKHNFPLQSHSLEIPECDDDPQVRELYRPFILDEKMDWISDLELEGVMEMAESNMRETGERLKILVLYGSLRQRLVLPCIQLAVLKLQVMGGDLFFSRSYSRLVAYEAARILFRLGCDVRIYNPQGLPMKDDVQHAHTKVQEIRAMSLWSDGHVWVSPEQHGNLVSFSNGLRAWCPL